MDETTDVVLKRCYLVTLEITPLEVGRTYDVLPSHLTLMSRFLSEQTPDELADAVRSVFTQTPPVELIFGDIEALGPKQVQAHMVQSPSEAALHDRLHSCLNELAVRYEYPAFVGAGHKAHVTLRDGVLFEAGSVRICSAAYLIEIVDHKRVIRAHFELGTTSI